MQVFQGQSEEVAKRFETFFDKRAKTESTIKELEKSKTEMKEELNDLIKKAKAFDIAAKGSDTNVHIKELEGKFQTFDKKRGAFAEQLEKLKNIIMGKDGKPVAKPAAPAKASRPSKVVKAVKKKKR